MANIFRTIHPVGQGAFYSERIVSSDDKKKDKYVVYDCGSFNKIPLKKEINSFAPEKSIIEILFISHFDSDHINGIKDLKERYDIQNVVIPLIKEKWIYVLENTINNNKDGIDLILHTKDYFGKNTKIILVNPVTDDDNVGENRGEPIDINGIPIDKSNQRKIKSNTAISVGPQKLWWCYIPFNYDETYRVNKFKKKSQGLNLKKN